MTLPTTQTIWGPYNGNDITTEFPYSGKIFSSDHLQVTKKELATGVIQLLQYNTHYAITGINSVNGGNVVTLVPLPTGYSLLIQRIVPIIQLTDLVNQGAFHSQTHEDVFDYLTMIDQQLKAQMPLFDEGIPLYFLRWKSDLSGIESVAVVTIGTLSISLVAGRVVFATGTSSLGTDAEFTWDNTLKTLSAGTATFSASNNLGAILLDPVSLVNKTANYFQFDNLGNHIGVLHTVAAISGQPVGSGQSGPASADLGLVVSNLKANYGVPSAIDGEIDGIYVFCRQGEFGDMGGVLIDVAAYNSLAFTTVLESVNSQILGGAIINQLNVQLGSIHGAQDSRVGVALQATVGTGTAGLYLGGNWAIGLNLLPATAGIGIALPNNSPIDWRDSGGIIQTVLNGGPDDVFYIGWVVPPPTNGHIVFRSSAEMARLYPMTELDPLQTSLELGYHNGAGLVNSPVIVGPADSGAPGYRVLMIAN